MPEEFLSFDPKEPQEVPGELVVKLTQEGSLAVSESIPTGPMSHLAAAPLPTGVGISAVDKVLGAYGVRSVTRIYSPFPSHLLAAADTGPPARDLASTFRVRLDPDADLAQAAKRLAQTKAVSEVSRNYYRHAFSTTPNDPMFGLQWGLTKIHCPEAWDRTTGSANVVVAVVDTGVDLNHPELAPLLLPGQDLVDLAGVSPRPGWHFEGDFLGRDNVPQDEVGHGSHVAGTIAALSDNNVGVAGVTWHCRLLPVKVLARMVRNSDGAVTGTGTAVDIAAGIRWATDNGAHIINMSLGGTSDTFVERDAVAYAVAQGVLVIAAMGNAFLDGNPISFPGAYPDVVAVGAIDQANQRASFSQTGPHIDVVAPGVGIRSTDWDDTYSNKSGTSMATPHVSGVAALIKSCRPAATASEIADILRDTAVPLRDSPADPVPNDRYGHGLIDAQAALAMACPKAKFADDIKFKSVDDPKLKFFDDPKLKFFDDPKFKFFDDKAKFHDDKPKFFDDVKNPAGDSPLGTGANRPAAAQPAPFVLATPHHSALWAGGGAGSAEEMMARYDQAIRQAEREITEMQAARKRGELSAQEGQRYEALVREYESMVADYKQLLAGQGH